LLAHLETHKLTRLETPFLRCEHKSFHVKLEQRMKESTIREGKWCTCSTSY